MKVLQVNISDTRGGASAVSWAQHVAYRKLNMHSTIAVKHKFSVDDQVIVMDDKSVQSSWIDVTLRMAMSLDKTSFPLHHKAAAFLRFLSAPGKKLREYTGIEEFNFPASRILDISEFDIIHCHVLHGNYFDLRNLATWSARKPVLITLHDAWLLAGHCAHSFNCDRWETGCSVCPDITIPVPIKRDNAALNWRRKKKIYSGSTLYVSTPCNWLMGKIEKSMLKNGIRMSRVITHGVDRHIFRAGDKFLSRQTLGIDQDAIVLLFSANGIKKNRWKDFVMMKYALHMVGQRIHNQKIIFIALGENAPGETIGNAEIRYIPYRSRQEEVALFYNASDVYLHGAKVDTFPNAVLEAISCGVPVIATAVGGIPEQVNGLQSFGHENINTYSDNEATGILTPPGDAEGFANAIEYLIRHVDIRKLLSENAAEVAASKFDLSLQVTNYLQWYSDIIADYNSLKK